jgi:hypothetical protein
MKTILSVLVLLISFSVVGQPPHEGVKREKRMEKMKKMTPEQQATLWSKKMTLELDLNESQQEQVHALILNKVNKQKERRANRPKERPSDTEIYQMKVNQLDEKIAMKKAMKSILTPAQFEIWEKKTKKKEHMKRKHLEQKKKGKK